jgi:hypothetical protein
MYGESAEELTQISLEHQKMLPAPLVGLEHVQEITSTARGHRVVIAMPSSVCGSAAHCCFCVAELGTASGFYRTIMPSCFSQEEYQS